MSGVELVAGVTAAFFAFGIMAGVLAVIALSAMRGHRMREGKRHRFGRYGRDQTEPIDWTRSAGPGRPRGPDWEDRPGWEEQPGPDDDDDTSPRWPGGHRGLTAAA